MFITLTVSSPWEWLLSKPIQKWMSKLTHRLKPGVVFFHLSDTFLTDPPILEVKTWFAHESAPDPPVLNCPYQSKPNLKESFDIYWARLNLFLGHVRSCARDLTTGLGHRLMARHYVIQIAILCCKSVKAWSPKTAGIVKCVTLGVWAHLWEVVRLEELGGVWGGVCTLDSVLNRYFC